MIAFVPIGFRPYFDRASGRHALFESNAVIKHVLIYVRYMVQKRRLVNCHLFSKIALRFYQLAFHTCFFVFLRNYMFCIRALSVSRSL